MVTIVLLYLLSYDLDCLMVSIVLKYSGYEVEASIRTLRKLWYIFFFTIYIVLSLNDIGEVYRTTLRLPENYRVLLL